MENKRRLDVLYTKCPECGHFSEIGSSDLSLEYSVSGDIVIGQLDEKLILKLDDVRCTHCSATDGFDLVPFRRKSAEIGMIRARIVDRTE